MNKSLFIPGPVNVKKEVLEKMSTPMIGHRGKEASNLQRSISEKLKHLYYTKEEVLLSTSSGTGLMEGAVRSCTAKKAAIFSVGAFGKRWYEMAERNNVAADLYEVAWGQATAVSQVEEALSSQEYDLVTITHNETSTGIMNPIEDLAKVIKKYPEVVFCVDAVSSFAGSKLEVDALGIDICISSTQKALALPPGMAACTFSAKARERAKQVKHRGYYFDLLELYNYIQKNDYQYPSTPSLSHMFAMDYQLDLIIEEGLEKRFLRHIEMAKYTRKWAKEKFAIFADERYLSNTLTTIENNLAISVSDLNKELSKRGLLISNGYGKLKDKTFRIAHMGESTLEEIKDLLTQIEEILAL